MIRDWFRLVGGGNQSGRGSGAGDACQILLLEQQGTLQNHLDLGAAGNIDVGIAGKERNDAYGGKACAEAGEPTLNGMA